MTTPPQSPAGGQTTTPFASMSLADFERIAIERNPTIKQAAAQFEAALARSLQAGLYPNPVVGYIQDQIGSFSQSLPTANGFAVQGKPSPGDNVGRIHPVAARDCRQAPAEPGQVCRGSERGPLAGDWPGASRAELRVRIQYFDVLAAERLIDLQREIVKLDNDAVRTTQEMRNVGQAGEPELLQARVQERRARVALRNAENQYRGDWEELVSLLGAPSCGRRRWTRSRSRRKSFR